MYTKKPPAGWTLNAGNFEPYSRFALSSATLLAAKYSAGLGPMRAWRMREALTEWMILRALLLSGLQTWVGAFDDYCLLVRPLPGF